MSAKVVGRPVWLTCSPTEFSHLAAIGQAYADTPDTDLSAAMLALWQDAKAPHNLGVFKSRLPDLLAAAQHDAEDAAKLKRWMAGGTI